MAIECDAGLAVTAHGDGYMHSCDTHRHMHKEGRGEHWALEDRGGSIADILQNTKQHQQDQVEGSN